MVPYFESGPTICKEHNDCNDVCDSYYITRTGRNIWVVPPTGDVAISAEKTNKCPKSMIAHAPKLSGKAMYVNQRPGDTLLLRYAWQNAVLTFCLAEQWTFLLRICTENDENRVQNNWKEVGQSPTFFQASLGIGQGPQRRGHNSQSAVSYVIFDFLNFFKRVRKSFHIEGTYSHRSTKIEFQFSSVAQMMMPRQF